MKRDLSIITDEVKKLIRKWLNDAKLHGRYPCPFRNTDRVGCPTICDAIFPTLESMHHDKGIVCPCDAFGKTYVIKIAKEIIQS